MYPQNMSELFAAPYSGDFAEQQFTNASNNDKASLAQTLQNMDFEKQKLPFQLSKMGLENQTTEAQLPGVKANSSLLTDKAGISKSTYDDQLKQAYKELHSKMSDEDLKMVNNHLEQTLADPDTPPAVRTRASAILKHTKQFQMEKMKEDAANARAAIGPSITSGAAERMNQANIEAGRWNRLGRGGQTEQQLIAKMGYEKAAVFYDNKAMEAELNGDAESVQLFKAQADKMKVANEQQKILAAQQGQAGKVAIDQLPGANLPVRPGATPKGFGGSQPQAAPSGAIQQAVESAGGKYEPDKFEYRINPETGKVQRKPKG